MNRSIWLLAAAFLGGSATQALAVSCGTVASPTACSVALGNANIFTASAFQLSASSGTTTYQASDILITLLANGSNAALQFSKNTAGPTAGTVFFVNPGGSTSFNVTYTAQIAPGSPGTAAFTDAAITAQTSAAGNGATSVEFTLPGMSGCQITPAGASTLDCNFPSGIGTSTTGGILVNITANTGNGSVGTVTNTYLTSFTTAPTSGVPEPSSFAMLGLGMGAIAVYRRRR